ncbi:polysaccharide deacetylase family protein [Aquincola sp. S2]|uniref:Polysaccharide deacetylase family protein n=1 Tax=Pseudaquabacterium terrae TaxID=2732868 RepID=A0ABX2ED87_9BURK|nr:polysaccharide deacetylase family protein [Aquabacterium terrae]NRF66522.1 polysaccharide deacetylase family protein [Aquabacterium terrae]
MINAAMNLLSPGGANARLSILIYHRVLAQADELQPDLPDAASFDRQMRWVASSFNVLPLDVAVRLRDEGRLPHRAAAITFDDGYADNLTQAMPILQRHGISATFFITTGYLDGGRMWNDTISETIRRCPRERLDLSDLGLGVHALATLDERRAAIHALQRGAKYLPPPQRQRAVDALAQHAATALPNDLMMTSDQLRALRDGGMQIGGHTVTHPILARITPDEARAEMHDGKTRLEALLQQPVTLFAYPNGVPQRDYLPEHVEMLRSSGFHAAVTTAAGAADRHADRYQLPRFTPWDKTRQRFRLRMALNLRNPGQTVAAAAQRAA